MRWAGLGGRGDECAAGVRPISATKGRLIDEMSVERVIRLFCLLGKADVGQDTRAWLMLRLKMAKTSCCVTASVRFFGTVRYVAGLRFRTSRLKRQNWLDRNGDKGQTRPVAVERLGKSPWTVEKKEDATRPASAEMKSYLLS